MTDEKELLSGKIPSRRASTSGSLRLRILSRDAEVDEATISFEEGIRNLMEQLGDAHQIGEDDIKLAQGVLRDLARGSSNLVKLKGNELRMRIEEDEQFDNKMTERIRKKREKREMLKLELKEDFSRTMLKRDGAKDAGGEGEANASRNAIKVTPIM